MKSRNLKLQAKVLVPIIFSQRTQFILDAFTLHIRKRNSNNVVAEFKTSNFHKKKIKGFNKPSPLGRLQQRNSDLGL